MHKNIDDAINSMYKIENGLLRRQPRMDSWKGMFVATAGKWNFAYKVENNIVYVYDACHSQNIHESSDKRIIRLTEEDLRRMVKKALMTVITEEYSFPTNLTPGDVMIGFGKILTKIDKSGILTHAEMNELIHLGLYFNPQYSCGYFDKKKRISPHRFQQDTCSEH